MVWYGVVRYCNVVTCEKKTPFKFITAQKNLLDSILFWKAGRLVTKKTTLALVPFLHRPDQNSNLLAYGNCARDTSGSQNRGVLSVFSVTVQNATTENRGNPSISCL